MSDRALAPAKVNLFLHVGAPGPDGYHPLVSLMVFADIGDELTIEAADAQRLTIVGPHGQGLSAGADNLVMRAAQALLFDAGLSDAGFHLILDKRLPVAAGLGGGSSDAGAALRLVNAHLRLAVTEARLEALASRLGADGAACFRASSVMAGGRGERLGPPPQWPALPCVLVNPGIASSTPAVYRAFDAAGSFSALDAVALPDLDAVQDVAALLAGLSNDLEAPALALAPGIAAPLAALRASPEALLARMSGSGATCFALCADDGAARALADRLSRNQPGWWVRACRLNSG